MTLNSSIGKSLEALAQDIVGYTILVDPKVLFGSRISQQVESNLGSVRWFDVTPFKLFVWSHFQYLPYDRYHTSCV